MFCPNWKSPAVVQSMNKILTTLGSYPLGQEDIAALLKDYKAFKASHSTAYMEALAKAYNVWEKSQGDEAKIADIMRYNALQGKVNAELVAQNYPFKNAFEEGSKYIYDQQPALEEIGTLSEYRTYLESIFPSTNVPTVMYHGTKRPDVNDVSFSKKYFKSGEGAMIHGAGFYFTDFLPTAELYAEKSQAKGESFIITALLDADKITESNLRKNVNVSIREHNAAIYDKIEELRKEKFDSLPDVPVPDDLLKARDRILQLFDVVSNYYYKKIGTKEAVEKADKEIDQIAELMFSKYENIFKNTYKNIDVTELKIPEEGTFYWENINRPNVSEFNKTFRQSPEAIALEAQLKQEVDNSDDNKYTEYLKSIGISGVKHEARGGYGHKKGENHFIVFEPEQIYPLGTPTDINNFKEWKANKDLEAAFSATLEPISGTPDYIAAYNQVTDLLGPVPVEFIQGLIDGVGVAAFDSSLGLLLSDQVTPVSGAAYHEAFEIVWATALSNNDQLAMLAELKNSPDYNGEFANKVREAYPELDQDNKDKEVLAELFREYMLTGQTMNMQATPRLESWLDKLWAYLKRLAKAFGYSGATKENKANTIYTTFADIKAKKYKYNPTAYNKFHTRVYAKKELDYFEGQLTSTQIAEYVDFINSKIIDVYDSDITIAELLFNPDKLESAIVAAYSEISTSQNELDKMLTYVPAVDENGEYIVDADGDNEFKIAEVLYNPLFNKFFVTDLATYKDSNFYKTVVPAFFSYWKNKGVKFNEDYVSKAEEIMELGENAIEGEGDILEDDDTAGNIGEVTRQVFDRTATEYSVSDSITNDTMLFLGLLTHYKDAPEYTTRFGTKKPVKTAEVNKYLLNFLKDKPYDKMLFDLYSRAKAVKDAIDNNTKLISIKDATLVNDIKYNSWLVTLAQRLLPVGALDTAHTKESLDEALMQANYTKAQLKTIIGFLAAFNRVYLNHYIALNTTDGDFRVFSSNQDTAEKRLQDKLETAQINSGVFESLTVAKLNELANRYDFDKNKQYLDNFLSDFGFNKEEITTLLDKDRKAVGDFVEAIRGNLVDKLNSKDAKFTKGVAELTKAVPTMFSVISALDQNGRKDTFLAAMSKHLPDDNEMQFLGLNGKNQYPITEYTLFAEYLQILNEAQTLEEVKAQLPLAASVYADNSVLLDFMFPNGVRNPKVVLEYVAADGVKAEGNTGVALRKTSLGDKLMFEIHALLDKKIYTLLQTSDKSTVLGFKVTVNQTDKFGLLSKFGVSSNNFAGDKVKLQFLMDNPHITKIYKGYLQAEYNTIVDYFANNGYSQFANYKKFGGDFRLFDAILPADVKQAFIESAKADAKSGFGPNFDSAFTSAIKTSFEAYLADYFTALFKKEYAEVSRWQLLKRNPIIDYTDAIKKGNLLPNIDNISPFVGLSRKILNVYKANSTGNDSELAKYAILQYAIEKQISYVEQTKLFVGDIAFLKIDKAGELVKRMSFASATIRRAINTAWYNGRQEMLMALDNAVPKSVLKEPTEVAAAKITTANMAVRMDYANMPPEYRPKAGTVRRLIIKDIVLADANAEIIARLAKAARVAGQKLKGLSGKALDDYVAKMSKYYDKITENDAQTYMTIHEYREFGQRTEQWNNYLEAAYWAEVNGVGEGAVSDFSTGAWLKYPIYFNVVKPFGRGHNAVEGTNIVTPQMDKQSIFPLVPSVIKGTNLDRLYKFMSKFGIGHILPHSATKTEVLLGPTGKGTDIYNDLLNKTDEELEAITFDNYKDLLTIEEVPYNSYGIQVQTENTVKNKVIDATQKRKIQLADIFAGGEFSKEIPQEKQEYVAGLIKQYNEAYAKLWNNEAGKLKEMLYDENNNLVLTKLVDAIRQSILESNAGTAPDVLLDAIESIETLGTIDHLNVRDKVESIIAAMVDNRLVRYKSLGEGYVQVAVTGWENAGQRNFSTDNTLKFYELVENSDGSVRTLPMQAYLPLPQELIYYVDKAYKGTTFYDKLAAFNDVVAKINIAFRQPDFDINSLSQEEQTILELTQVTGYRIPTQALNSIEYLQVAKYLHPKQGATIVLPSEITAKTGGDFDFDKMPVLRKAVNEKLAKKGTLEIVRDDSKAGLFNQIVEASLGILGLPENFERLITPDGPGIFEEMVQEIAEKQQKEEKARPKTDMFTGHYNNAMALANWVSKDLVGIGAVNVTHHTHAQMGNYMLFPTLREPISDNAKTALKKKGIRVDESNKLQAYSVSDYNTIFPHNTAEFEGKTLVSIAEVYDSTEEYRISTVLGNSVTAFVDGAKNPIANYLNINSLTAGAMYLALREGVHPKLVLYWLSQPLIREYVEQTAINETSYMKAADTLFSAIIRADKNKTLDITRDVEKYREKRPVKSNMDLQATLLKDSKYGSGKFTIPETTEDWLNLAKKELENPTTEGQRILFTQFLLDTKMAKALRDANATVNTDTKGVGGSHAGVLAATKLREEVMNVPHVYGIHNTLNPEKNFLGSIDQSLTVAHDLFKIVSIVPTDVIDYLFYKYPQRGQINTTKFFHLIKNDFVAFLIQQSVVDEEDNMSSYVGLRNGAKTEGSLANQLENYFAKYKTAKQNNYFLNQFTSYARKKGGIVVKLKQRKYDIDEWNRLYDAFEELYDKGGEHQELAANILRRIFLQSGQNKSAVSFLDKIPPRIYMEVLKVREIIEDYKTGNTKIKVSENNIISTVNVTPEQLNNIFVKMFATQNSTHPLTQKLEALHQKESQYDYGQDSQQDDYKPLITYWSNANYYSVVRPTNFTNTAYKTYQEKKGSTIAYQATTESNELEIFENVTTNKLKADIGIRNFGSNKFTWARYSTNGFEVSSKGSNFGKQFSAFNAILKDGRSIELAYQQAKGYDTIEEAKGKPAKTPNFDYWNTYLKLWQQWANENPALMQELYEKAKGKVLTDQFANSDNNQARALAEILNTMFGQESQNTNIVAIIGTAGRNQIPTKQDWDNVVADAKNRIKSTDTLISGGAAFADHIAVKLYLDGVVDKLILKLPAPFKNGKFEGVDNSGSAANYYHKQFSDIIGVNTLKEIEQAIAKGADVEYEPVGKGYSAFMNRNTKVANAAGKMLAYTFGEGTAPEDGGTKDTWDKNKGIKLHIPISKANSNLIANPTNWETNQFVGQEPQTVLGEKLTEGVYVNQAKLSEDEQLELFELLKPTIKTQAAKTNKGTNAPYMFGIGLRWDYVDNNLVNGQEVNNPINIDNPLAKEEHKYKYYKKSINGKPLLQLSDMPRMVELIGKATGIDISDYDAAIVNIYDADGFISNHADLQEDSSAIKYPVVAVNIGGNGTFVLQDEKTKENIAVQLQAGTGYSFGVDGKNRKAYHRTFPSIDNNNRVIQGILPTIEVNANSTNSPAKIFKEGEYRITITMRRANKLTASMPESPKILQNTVNTSESTVNLLTELSISDDAEILTELTKTTNDPLENQC